MQFTLFSLEHPPSRFECFCFVECLLCLCPEPVQSVLHAHVSLCHAVLTRIGSITNHPSPLTSQCLVRSSQFEERAHELLHLW